MWNQTNFHISMLDSTPVSDSEKRRPNVLKNQYIGLTQFSLSSLHIQPSPTFFLYSHPLMFCLIA